MHVKKVEIFSLFLSVLDQEHFDLVTLNLLWEVKITNTSFIIIYKIDRTDHDPVWSECVNFSISIPVNVSCSIHVNGN